MRFGPIQVYKLTAFDYFIIETEEDYGEYEPLSVAAWTNTLARAVRLAKLLVKARQYEFWMHVREKPFPFALDDIFGPDAEKLDYLHTEQAVRKFERAEKARLKLRLADQKMMRKRSQALRQQAEQARGS